MMKLNSSQTDFDRLSIKTSSGGFTIVELMIASAVFSVILLLCTFGLITLGRVYNKGVTISRTQEVTRTVMDDIAQSIQFSGQNPIILSPSPDGINGFCIDSRRYSFRLGIRQDVAPNHKVLVSDRANCGAGTVPLAIGNNAAVAASQEPREFLAGDMRLARLEVMPVAGASGLYSVRVKVVAGAYDLLTPMPHGPNDPAVPTVMCRHEIQGSQFCAAAELSTVVQKRLN